MSARENEGLTVSSWTFVATAGYVVVNFVPNPEQKIVHSLVNEQATVVLDLDRDGRPVRLEVHLDAEQSEVFSCSLSSANVSRANCSVRG